MTPRPPNEPSSNRAKASALRSLLARSAGQATFPLTHSPCCSRRLTSLLRLLDRVRQSTVAGAFEGFGDVTQLVGVEVGVERSAQALGI